MKTKITVTELSHDDLVTLLSTALYGSSWFEATYNKNIYNSLKKTEGDCFEDKLADMLLNGEEITITDCEADGVYYSKKFVKFDDNTDAADYKITLKDVLKTASTVRGYQLIKDVLSGDGDYWTADSFLQLVVFGKEIYG